jgi:hypothetical protein
MVAGMTSIPPNEEVGETAPGANATDTQIIMPNDPPKRHFVKTNQPNLVKLMPLGTYYARCKIGGKTVRQSLKTKVFEVAKRKARKWLIDVRGRVNAFEGNMGSLLEEYKRRLNLSVDSRDIRERTMATKIECLTQIEKVWEELFTTGQVNRANYARGGDRTKRQPAKYA